MSSSLEDLTEDTWSKFQKYAPECRTVTWGHVRAYLWYGKLFAFELLPVVNERRIYLNVTKVPLNLFLHRQPWNLGPEQIVPLDDADFKGHWRTLTRGDFEVVQCPRCFNTGTHRDLRGSWRSGSFLCGVCIDQIEDAEGRGSKL